MGEKSNEWKVDEKGRKFRTWPHGIEYAPEIVVRVQRDAGDPEPETKPDDCAK